MEHLEYGEHGVQGLVVLLLVAIALALVAGLVWWMIRRQKPARPDTVVSDNEDQFCPVEKDILAMVRQYGGPMPQSEVARNIALEEDTASRVLRRLEEQSALVREWDAERCEFMVTLPPV